MCSDLHQRITATILAQLGTADPGSWSPPWHGADALPRNALTCRRYRGLNVLALWASAHDRGYTDARWASYRQWAALGAQVRKGERGTLVLFYKDLPDRPSRTLDVGAGDTDEASPRFVARASFVFNVAQVDVAPDTLDPASEPIAPQPTLAAFAMATEAVIVEGGVRACYVPATDSIHLPTRSAFRTHDGYAATLAHELVHWTGAPHRLARDLTGRHGARAYAAEELVAEIGAAFILADLGLARSPHPDHAAYCAAWVPLLRADPRALASAAVHASRAAEYLAGLQLTGEADSDGSIAASIAQEESRAVSVIKPDAAHVARTIRGAA